jgi:hypothetical protein
MEDNKRNGRFRWLKLVSWLVFAAGLFIQLISPRLEISKGAFVIPAALSAEGNDIRPDEIVAKERRKQLISALLTATGALGLAYCYRHAFRRKSLNL